MKTKVTHFTTLLMAMLLAVNTAYAQKPEDKGNKGKGKAKSNGADVSLSLEGGIDAHIYFNDDRVRLIRDYYSGNRSAAGCPPGLAKKGNGCRPPGLAKKWRRGAPLPDDVVYHDVPDGLIVELGFNSRTEKIVRVGTDLLLIAVGTGMVIDAIEDLDDVF